MDTKLQKPSVYGYIQSQLDGTEHIFNIDSKIEIPDEYTWEDILPPVKNQGNTQTCVCQSLTCILDFITNCDNNTPGEANGYSVNELYNMRSNKPQEGMSIKEGMDILKKKGLNGMKINSYAIVPSAIAAKTAIMMFGPIAIGTLAYDGDPTYYWKERGKCMGGHAATLVGFDKKHFIVRNSWGKSWGNHGYAKMSYNDFEKYVLEAWTATI